MKLVDLSGKEITSKENKEAVELEEQVSKKTEKLLEPVFNKIKLSGAQVPQQQLMQLSSAAHQMLFNRILYNLLIKSGVKNIDELFTEDDMEELQTTLKNQIQMVDRDELMKQMQEQESES